MKKNLFSLRGKACAFVSLAAGAMLLASCAQDGYDDDERWDSGVSNTQLVTPGVDEIVITPNVDGTQMTISWPVVYGAGGYDALLTNETTGEVLVDSVFDAISFVVPRTADTNYKLLLTVLGNEEKNNTAGEQVVKDFNTFAVAIATIPENTDLTQYFTDNPVQAQESGDAVYDLVAGGPQLPQLGGQAACVHLAGEAYPRARVGLVGRAAGTVVLVGLSGASHLQRGKYGGL